MHEATVCDSYQPDYEEDTDNDINEPGVFCFFLTVQSHLIINKAIFCGIQVTN